MEHKSKNRVDTSTFKAAEIWRRHIRQKVSVSPGLFYETLSCCFFLHVQLWTFICLCSQGCVCVDQHDSLTQTRAQLSNLAWWLHHRALTQVAEQPEQGESTGEPPPSQRTIHIHNMDWSLCCPQDGGAGAWNAGRNVLKTHCPPLQSESWIVTVINSQTEHLKHFNVIYSQYPLQISLALMYSLHFILHW